MKISILTATYNRAKYLTKLYESLVQNIGQDYDIEWLIMDDGSTDDTQQICQKFKSQNHLNIKFYKQENQGKMQAINNLSKFVTGDIWIELDSDDYFIPNALKIIAEKSAVLEQENNLYAIVFLRYEDGDNISGNYFPLENEDTTMFDLYFKHKVTGEKTLVYKTEIRKKYNYIIEDGEKFCTEARLQHKMDLDYKIRCYNQALVKGDYLTDGYTKNIKKIFLESPKGHYEYFKEMFIHDMKGVKFNKRLYAVKHLILFSYLTKKGIVFNKK